MNTGTRSIEALEALVQELQEENRQLRLLLLLESTNKNQEIEAVESSSTTTPSVTSSAFQSITDRRFTYNNNNHENGTEMEQFDTTDTAIQLYNEAKTLTTNEQHCMYQNQNQNQNQQVLSNDTIERYSRQMFILGVNGQQQLQKSSVLVIGAGGIGSTVLYYLAGAGIGTLDVMDHDRVEVSNLHRQIIHCQPGIHKAISAQQALLRFNPTINCHAICEQLSTLNAMQHISKYDVIVDATDNATSRYIINDACVLLKKPLISGSAITTQGQLTVYINRENIDDSSCCYRCMYPNLNNECQSCNDAGVLGPVPGLIGILQALETIKLLATTASATASSASSGHRTLHDKLFMYDAMSSSFMTITKPKKNPNCSICGPHPTITNMNDTFHDLHRTATTCRMPMPHIKNHSYNDISCRDYHDNILCRNVPHVLLDVRVKIQYDICSLSNSVNIPLEDILQETTKEYIWTELSNHTNLPIYCICRRGIASREAVRILHDAYLTAKVIPVIVDDQHQNRNKHTTYTNHDDTVGSNIDDETSATAVMTTTESQHRSKQPDIYNIVGGYVAWQQHVDPTFPRY